MSNGPVQPVIIVKKKGGHGGHHGGAWKVAYADFVTAMMAFFLVMWLVSQSKDVKAGVGGYSAIRWRSPRAAAVSFPAPIHSTSRSRRRQPRRPRRVKR